MFLWQRPVEGWWFKKGPLWENNPFSLSSARWSCKAGRGGPGLRCQAGLGPSKASVQGGSGTRRAQLLHLALAWKALHPNPPGDRASRCSSRRSRGSRAPGSVAGPRARAQGPRHGRSRGRHFSPGHGPCVRPRTAPPRGAAPSPLTRGLAGLWPGAAGVAEHREAEVAQALTYRVRQLHAGSARPRRSHAR